MIGGVDIFLPLADHGDIVSALPFFAPAFMIIGVIVFMRMRERAKGGPEDRE